MLISNIFPNEVTFAFCRAKIKKKTTAFNTFISGYTIQNLSQYENYAQNNGIWSGTWNIKNAFLNESNAHENDLQILNSVVSDT